MCFNCHNTGHFARECKFKSTKDGSRQETSRGQDFKPVRTEKEALMTIDEGQINWVEQTTDEELTHALVSYIQAHQRSNHKDQQHCLFACFLSQFEEQEKVFDVSPFSANDFEYSNRKQTPLSSCESRPKRSLGI
ncbi:putative ribonuclease H-like domain-containing protein [Tanacetum coccineum]